MAAVQTLRRTALFERHRAAGARLVPFAGCEMPVRYLGIREEHLAVRRDVGVFDVSHMGQIELGGGAAGVFLQRMLSNDLDALDVGGAQYSVLCRDDGGILDDLFAYRLAEDRYLLVTNASNHAQDLAWLGEHADDYDVCLTEGSGDYAMLAVQGPAARALLESMAEAPLPARMRAERISIEGVETIACGTGYTGEDGLELLASPAGTPQLWDALVAGGATPAGLGARDTLRLEVCYPLYGNDLSESRGPIEAGLGWCCVEATGFVGAGSVLAAREAGPREKLVPFTIEGEGIARPGNAVIGGGEVTSGTFSPSLGVGIGMAYLPAAMAHPGETIEIDVRGRRRRAVVGRKPLYRKGGAD